MGKTKAKQPVENEDGEDDSQLLPRTRRRTKSQPAKQEDSSSDEDDEVVQPASEVKPTLKSYKTAAPSESPSNSTEAPEVPDMNVARKRKGGNKRRFTHEYCLTCRHYGRACSGRREGQDGCSICRDPNREKGEKLRECLWANPELGVFTYEEARVVHKEAQAERRAREKARLREQRANANSNKSALKVSVAHGPPPPVHRQLDVVPPPSATIRSQNTFVTSIPKQQNDDTDTITVDTAPTVQSPPLSHLPSMNGEPGPKIHRPTIIKLRVKNPAEQESLASPSLPPPSPSPSVRPPIQQLPQSSRPLSFVPPPIPRGPPYYDISIQAWRFPSQAGTYLAPSDIPSASYPVYESPYGHPPAFTAAVPNFVASPSHGTTSSPKTEHFKTRPLDKSGTPCRKWARTDSEVATTSGASLKSRKWKSNDGAAELGDEKKDDSSISDLSSVIDVDDPSEFEKAVRDVDVDELAEASPVSHSAIVKDDPEYVMVHSVNGAGDETEEDEDEEEDRLQAQINRMIREKTKKSVTQPSTPATLETQPRNHATPQSNVKPTARDLPTSMIKRGSSFTAINSQTPKADESSNDSGTDDEGPLKRLPPEIRNKLSRTATTHIRISETETITIRPEHFKGEALRARSTSQSADGESTDLQFRPGRKRRSQAKTASKRKGHNGVRKSGSTAIKTEDEDEDETEEIEGSDGQDVDMVDV